MTFSVTTDGFDTTIQWMKNRAIIPGATQKDFTIASVTAADAGDYSVKVGTLTSTAAKLIVFSSQTEQRAGQGKSGTLKVTSTLKSGISYRWKSPSGEWLDKKIHTRYSGTDTTALTIKKCEPSDGGLYTCQVLAFSPPQTLTLDPILLEVLGVPEVDSSKGPPEGTVTGAFYWQIVASNDPTKYAVSGLPSGLKLDATKGIVSGVPTAATKGAVTLKVTATNLAGAGPVQEFPLTITEFPQGSQGNFAALVEPSVEVNEDLGGLLTATVTANGNLSGKLRLGGTTYSFAKRCVGSVTEKPKLDHTITRKGELAPIDVHLDFDPDTNGVTGTVTIDGVSVDLKGWRDIYVKTTLAEKFAGSYNASVTVPEELAEETDVPQGYGWMQATLTTAGAVKGSGRMPDGANFTWSGFVWPDGGLPVNVVLYKNKGSVHGAPIITSDEDSSYADNMVGGTLRLIKTGASATSDRTYKDGYEAIELAVEGEKWVKPTVDSLLLGVAESTGYNALLKFKGGGLEDSVREMLSQPFQITTKHGTVLAKAGSAKNLHQVALKLTAATGLFSGNFVLVDVNPVDTKKKITRKVTFNGILLRERGWGQFLLPELPNASNSPFFSGKVELKPNNE